MCTVTKWKLFWQHVKEALPSVNGKLQLPLDLIPIILNDPVNSTKHWRLYSSSVYKDTDRGAACQSTGTSRPARRGSPCSCWKCASQEFSLWSVDKKQNTWMMLLGDKLHLGYRCCLQPFIRLQNTKDGSVPSSQSRLCPCSHHKCPCLQTTGKQSSP